MWIFGKGKGKSVLAFGANGVISAGGDSALRYGLNDAWSVGLPNLLRPQILIVSPYAGFLFGLQVINSAVLGAGITCQYTAYINSSATTLLCQISGAGATQGQDITNRVLVARGDLIALAGTRVAGVPPAVISAMTMGLEAA